VGDSRLAFDCFHFGRSHQGASVPLPIIHSTQRLLVAVEPHTTSVKDLIMLLMTSYLIASHAVMLVVLLRIAVKVLLQAK
jgi:hypothetical protein